VFEEESVSLDPGDFFSRNAVLFLLQVVHFHRLIFLEFVNVDVGTVERTQCWARHKSGTQE
jgi:hypothetical protein